MALIGKAPLTTVRTASQGFVLVYAGAEVPADILEEDAARLVEEGYLVDDPTFGKAKVGEPQAPAAGTVEAVLAEVGDDKANATEALEQEKAGKNRSTLVKQLEAIVNG